MSCCGRRRQLLRAGTPPAPAVEVPSPMVQNPVALTYRGEASLVVKGPATGLAYLFGARGAALEVDGRDAPELMASGLIELVAAAVAEQQPHLQPTPQSGVVGD
jgi:hypothetical protein